MNDVDPEVYVYNFSFLFDQSNCCLKVQDNTYVGDRQLQRWFDLAGIKQAAPPYLSAIGDSKWSMKGLIYFLLFECNELSSRQSVSLVH